MMPLRFAIDRVFRVVCCVLLGVATTVLLLGCQQYASTVAQASGPVAAHAPSDTIRWATYSRQRMADRRAGVERMLRDDSNGFWLAAATHARWIDDWSMIRLLCEKAEASGDADARPWLIRSWAMRSRLVADEERPERRAIEAITDRAAHETLREVFFDDTHAGDLPTRVAAWTVLRRVEEDIALRTQLAESSSADPLIAALRIASEALDVLPRDRVEIAHLMYLDATLDTQSWRTLAAWRQSQRQHSSTDIALRHVPLILRRDRQRDAWSREQWVARIESRLTGRRHASRGEGANSFSVIVSRPDRFADHVDTLGLADLMLISHLLDAFDDSEICAAAFQQAESDRRDVTSELGGALTWNAQSRLALTAFAPYIRRHDEMYIASSACMRAAYDGLAHYHFHAQKYHNAEWAGPGQGDLKFVRTQHVTGVVLTYLDERTLNVDAYFPCGAIIDLGCLTR